MDILSIVKQVAQSLLARRKKLIVLTTVLALLIFMPAAYLLSQEPPRFRTSSTVLLESKVERTAVLQEFAPYRPLPVQIAILQSRALAEAVIEALPRASIDDLIENPYSRNYWVDFQNALRRARGLPPNVESPQQRALAELRNARVTFNAQGASGIVEVRAEASKPRVALDIANTYIDVLLSRTRSFNVDDAKTTREYLTQQATQVSESLHQSEIGLRTFTTERGGVRLPDRAAEAATRLSQLETTLAEVQANRNMSQSRLSALKAKLDAMPAAAKPTAATAPPAQTQRLRARLAAFEAQLVDAQTRYTDEHPRVRLLKQQIAEVQRTLGDAVKDSTVADLAGSNVPTQDREAFAEMVAALDTSATSLTAQEGVLREQIVALRRNLSGLSKDELEYQHLASQVETNRRLSTLLQDKLAAARLREQGEMNVVKVIDPPSFPVLTINEKRIKFLAAALGLALVAGLVLPGTAEYVNRPIQSEQDIRALLNLPVLTIVPKVQSRRLMFSSGNGRQYDAQQEDYLLFVDAFRRLRVELQLLGEDMPLRRILVASALPGEGKSSVVLNLGLAFGEIGKRVIIADADFHRPSLHRTAKSKNERGFTDLLAGATELSESLTPISEQVRLTPRGTSLTAPARAGLGTHRLTDVLDTMSSEAEYVLMDSSPILLVPDNLYMAAAADGILLVVDCGSSRPRDMVRAKELLERAGTPIVGVVLNRTPLRQMDYYSKHYSAYYRHS
jgi:succinoglycan biosynthesis transport protein ExoP